MTLELEEERLRQGGREFEKFEGWGEQSGAPKIGVFVEQQAVIVPAEPESLPSLAVLNEEQLLVRRPAVEIECQSFRIAIRRLQEACDMSMSYACRPARSRRNCRIRRTPDP